MICCVMQIGLNQHKMKLDLIKSTELKKHAKLKSKPSLRGVILYGHDKNSQ